MGHKLIDVESLHSAPLHKSISVNNILHVIFYNKSQREVSACVGGRYGRREYQCYKKLRSSKFAGRHTLTLHAVGLGLCVTKQERTKRE